MRKQSKDQNIALERGLETQEGESLLFNSQRRKNISTRNCLYDKVWEVYSFYIKQAPP